MGCPSVLAWTPWHEFDLVEVLAVALGFPCSGFRCLCCISSQVLDMRLASFFVVYLVTVLAAWQLLGGWKLLVFLLHSGLAPLGSSSSFTDHVYDGAVSFMLVSCKGCSVHESAGCVFVLLAPLT